jgi:hypothetical protein
MKNKMANTMNMEQKNYMEAKALSAQLESQLEEIERKFISDKGIKNSDGSVPSHLFCMDDDADFEIANAELSEIIVNAGLEKELNDAHDALKSAEDCLIEYGLSIVPAGIRSVLKEAAKKNFATREKIIDLTFRLDASTVNGQLI